MYVHVWVTSGSANGLLPDNTKPLPGSVGTYYWQGLVASPLALN